MKIYIHVNKNTISGYFNINLVTDSIDLNNMNSICERAECLEIIIDEAIEHLNHQQCSVFLSQFITRLRLNGKLIIIGTDIDMVINKYYNGQLSAEEFNTTIFGTSSIKKTSIYSIQHIQNILTENGLKIDSVELNSDCKFSIISKRTNNDS
jgi:predicted SAM-dependent methyltransferase